MCPWIKINWRLPWRTVFEKNKSSFIMLNHTSLLDGFLGAVVCPPEDIVRVRTMIKSALLKIPIFGRICHWVGHFPVYFTGSAKGDFKVDTEKQAKVSLATNEHIRDGGHIMFFPEGQVSDEPRQLQTFRRGAFALVKEHKPTVWGMAVKGAADTWPKSLGIGGLPANIEIDVWVMFTKEELDSMSVETLCDQAQLRFQARLDGMYDRAKRD